MKKVLFITLALAVGMTGFAQRAQQQRVKADKPVCVKVDRSHAVTGTEEALFSGFAPTTAVPTNFRGDDFGGWATMMTHYDIQSNNMMGNRMVRFEDGTLGVTATWGQASPGYADRGSGYNYYDGTSFIWDEFDGEPMPGRLEADKTGWPSYCQYGSDGEIVFSHQGFGSSETKICYYYREKKGEGEWQGPNYIPNPENLGTPAYQMTWPRAVASGPNHSILHVVAADQDDANTSDCYLYYNRSTDGGQTWTTIRMPLLTDNENLRYSAEDYALAANGNTVAIMLLSPFRNGYLLKSTDNGENWEKTTIWNNPFGDLDWSTDEASLWGGDLDDRRMYAPESGSICIDNDGMVHAAISCIMTAHDELGWSYSYYYSRTCDGIFYWDENIGTVVAPTWTCPDDGYVIESDPMNCFRMWWPTTEAGDYITRNWETDNHLIGFIPPTDEFQNMETDNLLFKNYFQNSSIHPAISVDDKGTIAVAYSTFDPDRDKYQGSEGNYYYRSVYVAFIEPGYVIGDATGDWTDIPGNVYYQYVKLQDADDFLHSMDEAIYVTTAANTMNSEFWFAYQADDTPGINARTGDSQTQSTPSDNIIWVQKVVPEYEGLNVGENPAVNPVTTARIYPNPVVDQMTIEVNASQASEMSISVYNLMGQKVMDKNVNINTGVNTPTLNTSSLSSGVYFVTVKANGFENTMKFIVK